jgi:hypothetical protein
MSEGVNFVIVPKVMGLLQRAAQQLTHDFHSHRARLGRTIVLGWAARSWCSPTMLIAALTAAGARVNTFLTADSFMGGGDAGCVYAAHQARFTDPQDDLEQCLGFQEEFWGCFPAAKWCAEVERILLGTAVAQERF